MSEDDWRPPTEAERKVLEKRRERSAKISQSMGSYLLKGYKMLDAECPACGTILLESKDKTKHCVSCIDLVSDSDKDDPATDDRAAQSLIEENKLKETNAPVCLAGSSTGNYSTSIQVLQQKINEMTQLLANKSDPIVILQLADTIRHLADAIKSLRDI
ncbi:DgyrCDS4841 [Dimorphilus gyrociliatus]|uniref:DgyrCDS4841 n=1 Tax=Dimorphilus gyrociliatus TaxID=2664684 RepID=A0A7I8VKT6_9ANNE|nr:DgyrCDS4841 [Dimorphilus gyrociliatus]